MLWPNIAKGKRKKNHIVTFSILFWFLQEFDIRLKRKKRCITNTWPLGGAVFRAVAAPCVWLNHFIHHTQNAKWDTETSAASSFSGYHGDARRIFTLSPSNKGFLPSLHANTRSVPCSAETCPSLFSPVWRKDIVNERHGSVGAVHKGKKCSGYIFV